MCYYSTLQGSGGKCRTCLVRVTKGSEKDPRPMPKLMASCQTPVMDGMEVASKSDATVVEARASVTEFLLINHPLDCPICDQAGECHLQDLAFEHGKASTRYEFERRTFEKIDIGPYIKLHMTRCIMCFRCVFVANQLTEQRVHGIINRGDHAEISTYIEKAIDNDFSGNIIDVCPVGALTDRTFRFKSRVWFLKPMEAECSCSKCSGKAVLWMFGDEIYRVTTRKDQYDEVESIDDKTAWICDECRFEKKDKSNWNIIGPREVDRHSVISQGKYETKIGIDIISQRARKLLDKIKTEEHYRDKFLRNHLKTELYPKLQNAGRKKRKTRRTRRNR
jgi:NADH-quinone oxidoreductase subunit G